MGDEVEEELMRHERYVPFIPGFPRPYQRDLTIDAQMNQKIISDQRVFISPITFDVIKITPHEWAARDLEKFKTEMRKMLKEAIRSRDDENINFSAL